MPGISSLLTLLAVTAFGPPATAHPVPEALFPTADSTELLREAREKQRNFERYRESRLPPRFRDGGGGCDDLVGRLCFTYGNEEDEAVPPEPPEVAMARQELLRTLGEVGDEIPGDRWVLGQRVYYMVAEGRWRDARVLLDRCVADDWWCNALRGYVATYAGDDEEAARRYREALDAMPPEYRVRFRSDVRHLLDRPGQALLDGLGEDERVSFIRTLWVLSDPLYLVAGNDRLTEHRTRVVGTFIRENAENPYDLAWEDDLAELVIRFGQEIGWSRARTVGGAVSGTDTRHVLGHHDPRSIQFVPPTHVLADPLTTELGAWEPEERTPFSGHVADYAPEMGGMDTQVARFRRGDSLLVVAAYRPAGAEDERAGAGQAATPEGEEADSQGPGREEDSASDPFGSLTFDTPAPDAAEGYFDGPVEAGAFLVGLDGETHARSESGDRSGAHTLTAPAGGYVLGVELFSPGGKRAWRARGGVTQDPLPEGLAAVSDILVLQGGEEIPESLETATRRALPSLRVTPGTPLTLAWEVYGLRPGEAAEVTVGFTRHQEGILRRLGEFLRVVETDEPIVVRFEEAAPDRPGTVFRALDVELPGLEPGTYDIHLEMDLRGRNPMVSSRRIEVVPPDA